MPVTSFFVPTSFYVGPSHTPASSRKIPSLSPSPGSKPANSQFRCEARNSWAPVEQPCFEWVQLLPNTSNQLSWFLSPASTFSICEWSFASWPQIQVSLGQQLAHMPKPRVKKTSASRRSFIGLHGRRSERRPSLGQAAGTPIWLGRS